MRLRHSRAPSGPSGKRSSGYREPASIEPGHRHMSSDRHRTRPGNSYVGSAIERIEDLRFLRGNGQFVDDVTRPGLLHAVILRSAVAHGRIRRIDCAAALARPGGRAVITAADIGEPIPTIPLRQERLEAFRRFEQPVIATGKVRYV